MNYRIINFSVKDLEVIANGLSMYQSMLHHVYKEHNCVDTDEYLITLREIGNLCKILGDPGLMGKPISLSEDHAMLIVWGMKEIVHGALGAFGNHRIEPSDLVDTLSLVRDVTDKVVDGEKVNPFLDA